MCTRQNSYSPHFNHTFTRNSTTAFPPLISHHSFNEKERPKLRIKAEELSLEKLPKASTSIAGGQWTPMKANWISSDVGLR